MKKKFKLSYTIKTFSFLSLSAALTLQFAFVNSKKKYHKVNSYFLIHRILIPFLLIL